MRQYLELAGLLGSIYIVQNFDYVFTMTSGGLGTANLPYTIYQTFYQAHDYGLASAAGVIVVVGTIIVATFALRTVSTLLAGGPADEHHDGCTDDLGGNHRTTAQEAEQPQQARSTVLSLAHRRSCSSSRWPGWC